MPTATPKVVARYPRGTRFGCPSCGREYTTPTGVNAVECNKGHTNVLMKEKH